MYELDKAAFGRFLAQLRREKGMTQKELAATLYVSDKAVSKWERGLSVPDISLLVPLADLMENRRLVVGFTLAASATLLCAGLTHSPSLFLLLSLLIGLTSVAVQILVPLAAHLVM